MTLRALLVLATLVVSMTSASAQVGSSAQIRGRVTDAMGASLPGVRVSLTGPGVIVPKEAVADDNGRFAFRDLLPSRATYTVTARLEGFEAVTVVVRASETSADSSFSIRMRIGCFGPGSIVDEIILPEIDPLVKDADVVALVRLDSVEDGYQSRVGDEYCGSIIAFRATILDAVKDRRAQRARSILFVMHGRERPFNPGEDYVALLKWQPGNRTHFVMGRSYFMPVRADQVLWPGGNKRPLADVLSTLRSISQPPTSSIRPER